MITGKIKSSPIKNSIAQAIGVRKPSRRRRAEGGPPSPMPPPGASSSDKVHVGPIHSPVAGRTDHLPMHVASGSYVIPADIISAMGEGNTMAGFRIAQKIFARSASRAQGGAVDAVPIVAAGGEYVIGPEDVAVLGGGNLDAGHAELDDFIKKYRAQTVRTLATLPGPKRD
jgi:hypothetical protein